MNNNEISHCYQMLDITSAVPAWGHVRKSYRRLMRQWHPDRARDTSSQRIAEDRTKTINVAYQKLAEFYEQHGYLPPNPSGLRERAPTPSRQLRPGPTAASAPEQNFRRDTSGSARDVPGYRLPGLRLLLALAIAVISVFIIFIPVFDTPNPGKPTKDIAPTDKSRSLHPARAVNTPGFTLGSTLGQVITAQGIPTRTDNNTWYFGQSTVVFENGVVASWEEHPDHPLKIDASRTGNHHADKLITYGSSRSQVSAIQGKPSHIENDVWHYGTSRIFFIDNRVVSWKESPLDPLRVQK